MNKFISFLQKRPSDATIRGIKIFMGLIIIALLGFYFNDFSLPIAGKYELYAKYAIFILGVMTLLGGITGMCGGKRKYVRIAQLIMGILFIVVGNLIVMKQPIIPEAPKSVVQTGSTIDFNALSSKPVAATPAKNLEIGFWIAWLSVFPLFGGITGKCITEKCLKYGEVIKKIRI